MADDSLADELLGTWIVDLRPTPDSDPYLQEFTIHAIEGDRFSGTFYSTQFEDGVLNRNWGVVYLAFTTADGRTSYHHSGKLEAGNLTGSTHAPGRQMLSVWSATRAE